MRSGPLQLERALEAMTLDVHQGRQRRERMLRDGHTGEFSQQVHVTLGGSAGPDWGFIDHPVTWEFPFVYAPLQRRVEFATPHFTHGFELLSAGSQDSVIDLVMLNAHVIGWNVAEEGWTIGATIRFTVSAPMAAAPIPYAAIAHLTFQGYASYAEGDEFPP